MWFMAKNQKPAPPHLNWMLRKELLSPKGQRFALGTRSSRILAIACSISNSSPPCVSFRPFFFSSPCAFQRGKHIAFQRKEQQKQEDGMAHTARVQLDLGPTCENQAADCGWVLVECQRKVRRWRPQGK